MIYFNCDYTEGAHPEILQMLQKTNMEQTVGYGEDEYCMEAISYVKKHCKRDDIEVQFLVGGTQTNLLVISSALRPHQGVMSASTGHINVHESGAIEATGHKVLAIPGDSSGKLSAENAEKMIVAHLNDETKIHTVQPKMVYISNSTENGAVYTKAELKSLSEVCKKYDLYLFLDGARLGYALASEKNDLTLEDLCNYCDVFYIGGTKVGALFGEVLIITNDAIKEDFKYMVKQKGALLAKGRLLGIQFHCLFKDNLYFEISKHAVAMANKIADALKDADVEFLAEPESNQIFPIFKDEIVEKIKGKYVIAFWEKVDEKRSAIRICTSWATTEENVNLLIEDILSYIQ